MKNRKHVTDRLFQLLIAKTNTPGVYGAAEVSIDWGTNHSRYIDYMTFRPKNTLSVSGIEKGEFACYEIKSCYEDLYSGKGLNFLGEKNYIVTTMETYKRMLPDLGSGKLQEHIRAVNPESFWKCNTAFSQIGVMVAVPTGKKETEEFDCPTPFTGDINWELRTIIPCHTCDRARSIIQLLFFMMRAMRR